MSVRSLAAGVLGALLLTGPVLARPAAAAAPSSYGLDQPDAAVLDGPVLFVANYGGNSVTEVNAATGAYISTISGARYHFDAPRALKLVGQALFVANADGNSVTELSASTGQVTRLVTGAPFAFSSPIAMATEGSRFLFVLSSGGSVAKISLATGKLVALGLSSDLGFDKPVAIVGVGNRLFIANEGNNTLTEVNAQTMGLVGIVPGSAPTASPSFDDPVAMVAQGGDVWVSNSGGQTVTELAASTASVVQVVPNTEDYLPMPGAITYGDGYFFVTSPPGASPMVTQVDPTDPATLPWMMCNTNGPYDFSNPQALAVYGPNLWVVNEGGAGGPPGGTLTEMDATTGALVQVVG